MNKKVLVAVLIVAAGAFLAVRFVRWGGVPSPAGAPEASPTSSAASAPATSTLPSSGIFGTVMGCGGTEMVGPGGRPPSGGGGCSNVAGAQIVLKSISDISGKRIMTSLPGTYTTDQNGNYRISTNPGGYVVCVSGGLCSSALTVQSGQFVKANIEIAYP